LLTKALKSIILYRSLYGILKNKIVWNIWFQSLCCVKITHCNSSYSFTLFMGEQTFSVIIDNNTLCQVWCSDILTSVSCEVKRLVLVNPGMLVRWTDCQEMTYLIGVEHSIKSNEHYQHEIKTIPYRVRRLCINPWLAIVPIISLQ